MIYFLMAVVVLVLIVIGIYNGLVRARQQVKEAWSTVETQLKRRYDLIPNLVETVKGYAKHESTVLENVIKARNMAMNAKDVAQKGADENMLTGALKSVFALSESYPALKANENFAALQQELSDTETKVQSARQFYNTMVLHLNTKIQMFPSNLIAKQFGFVEEPYFELDESEKQAAKQAPQVKF